MNTNKIGKYILLFSVPVFIITLLLMLFSEIIHELVGTPLILFTYLISCISLAMVYYHSIPTKRKKAIKIMTIISISVFVIGWTFKFLHWPGAAICILTSCVLFSFACLPLIIKSRYENRKTLLTKAIVLLSLADLLSVLCILMGLLFKVLHWPGGNYLTITGTILLIMTFVFWNLSFRKEVKLRLVAEEQLKETLNEVKEKQREITDSINYAKRIQEAILPSFEFIKMHLPNSFIYYRPKDIVAGDFYWAEKVEDKFFIAAADCTGHGVPGALVSVVCYNALNKSIKEFKQFETGKILDKTRELVLETFEKSVNDVKDGMDISLLCIDTQTKKIEWSGANNPLWYIQDQEFKEIKADKQPIGKTDYPKPFTTHQINYKVNTTLYLFTDGFADQFGGPSGKKFKYKQFSDILLKNYSLTQTQQSDLINKAFSDWKGELEQVDDVCVIGINI
jgi:serine phosphatase RsbU (regulator of sigma subunit)